jgi:hypothetical protein
LFRPIDREVRASSSPERRYGAVVKQIWSGRAVQLAGKYGEHAPTAAVCCNACRTCLTTNLICLATAAAGTVGYTLVRLARRARSVVPS